MRLQSRRQVYRSAEKLPIGLHGIGEAYGTLENQREVRHTGIRSRDHEANGYPCH